MSHAGLHCFQFDYLGERDDGAKAEPETNGSIPGEFVS